MSASRTVFSRLAIASSSRQSLRPVAHLSPFGRSPIPSRVVSRSRVLHLSRTYASGPASDEERRARAAVGPFTYRAALLFVLTGAGLYWYFETEKAKVTERRRQELLTKSVGKPSIGGPFTLTTHEGGEYTEKDLVGQWTLVYFGFTNCPDICPEELDKMGEAVEMVEKRQREKVQPVFVSVDPARDGVEAVKRYVSDFHPRILGLTGSYDAVKSACKAYRVYFSTPPSAQPGDDYLVDHSIFFYLMDPLGQFVDAFGKNTTAKEVADKVTEAMGKWEQAGGYAAAGVEKKVIA